MVTKDVDANTVIVQYQDGKEEIVKRADLVDDGVSTMLPGPGDRLPPVIKTIPGKEINIHIPDKDIEVPYTKEQKEATVKAEKDAKVEADKKAKVAADKAKADKTAADKAAGVKTTWL